MTVHSPTALTVLTLLYSCIMDFLQGSYFKLEVGWATGCGHCLRDDQETFGEDGRSSQGCKEMGWMATEVFRLLFILFLMILSNPVLHLQILQLLSSNICVLPVSHLPNPWESDWNINCALPCNSRMTHLAHVTYNYTYYVAAKCLDFVCLYFLQIYSVSGELYSDLRT